MLMPVTGPSSNPRVVVPSWVPTLREALRTRSLEQEPPPEPLAWESLDLQDVENEKELLSLHAYALRFLEGPARDGARYLQEVLSGAAAGYHMTSALQNTVLGPELRVRVTRHTASHIGRGFPILDYVLTPIPTRHGCWPRVSVSVRGGRPQSGDFSRPAESADAVHLLFAHDVAADLARHICR